MLSGTSSTYLEESAPNPLESNDRNRHADTLKCLVAAMQEAMRYARINRQLCSNAQRRLLFISGMLQRLPDPSPTPEILTVLRSAACLIATMGGIEPESGGRVARDVLKRYFTCQALFKALRERTQSVWRLHSTASWEAEDRAAIVQDEQSDAELFIKLYAPTKSQLEDRSAITTSASSVFQSTSENEGKEEGEGEHGASKHTNKRGSCAHEHSEDERFHPIDRVVAERSAAAAAAANQLEAVAADVIAHYRRHELSSWKLPYEALDIDPTCYGGILSTTTGGRVSNSVGYCGGVCSNNKSVLVSLSNTNTGNLEVENNSNHSSCGTSVTETPHSFREVQRFVVREGFLYDGHVVLVKELEDPSLLSSLTVTAFVQDAVARARWCHPHVVGYYGGFSEKYVTREQEELNAHELAMPGGYNYADSFASNSVMNTQQQQQQKKKTAAAFHVDPGSFSSAASAGVLTEVQRRIRKERRGTCVRGTPRLALGLIMERLTPCQPPLRKIHHHPASRSDQGGHSRRKMNAKRTVTISPTSAVSAVESPALLYYSLHAVLFNERHQLSLVQAVRITLQVADALQYVLMDEDRVPSEVLLAWMSVAPSNIFIASKATAGGGVDGNSANTGEGRSRRGDRGMAREASASLSERHKSVEPIAASNGEVQHDGIDGSGETEETSVFHAVDSREALCFLQQQQQVQEQHHRTQVLSPPALSGPASCAATHSPLTSTQHSGARRPQSYITPIYLPLDADCTIKYAPPCFIENGPYSRWRPHPKAISPACYALAQLLLALITNKVPYQHLATQEALRDTIFDPPKSTDDGMGDEDGEVCGVKVSQPQGYSFPRGLPECLRHVCREAMSFRTDTKGAMTISEFRASLGDCIGNLSEYDCLPLSSARLAPSPSPLTATLANASDDTCAVNMEAAGEGEMTHMKSLESCILANGRLDDYGAM